MRPSQKCKKNGWEVGTVLESKESWLGEIIRHTWLITAIGRYEVLGQRLDKLKSEQIIPLMDTDYKWRRVGK